MRSHTSGLCFVVLQSRVGSLRCERTAQGSDFSCQHCIGGLQRRGRQTARKVLHVESVCTYEIVRYDCLSFKICSGKHLFYCLLVISRGKSRSIIHTAACTEPVQRVVDCVHCTPYTMYHSWLQLPNMAHIVTKKEDGHLLCRSGQEYQYITHSVQHSWPPLLAATLHLILTILSLTASQGMCK